MPICLTFRQEVEGHALVYYMHMDKEMHKTSAEILTFLMNRKKKIFFLRTFNCACIPRNAPIKTFSVG